jgi:hypothetical protein
MWNPLLYWILLMGTTFQVSAQFEWFGTYALNESVMLEVSPTGYRITTSQMMSEDLSVEIDLFNGPVKFIGADVVQLLAKDKARSVLVEFQYKNETLIRHSTADKFFDGVRTVTVPKIIRCFESTYRDGQVRFSGNLEDGKKTGTWEYYDRNGKLIRKVDF